MDHHHIPQGITFYTTTCVGNLDGTISLHDDGLPVYATANEALAAAKESVQGYGMVTYVIECRPIYKIARGRIQVSKVKAKAAPIQKQSGKKAA